MRVESRPLSVDIGDKGIDLVVEFVQILLPDFLVELRIDFRSRSFEARDQGGHIGPELVVIFDFGI